jgi:FKBP-type peptidyl-prolyl cis-trans isomerase SlyD
VQIAAQKIATLEYTLRNSDGELLDSSEESGSLTYLHGAENIVPGLEAALEGKTVGDKLHVEVPPKLAYGERDDDLVVNIPRDRLPEGEIEVGTLLRAATDSGETRELIVIDVGDVNVTVDGNHPLAGESLLFDVTVISVRDATEEEIAHGHAHDSHDHDHDH